MALANPFHKTQDQWQALVSSGQPLSPADRAQFDATYHVENGRVVPNPPSTFDKVVGGLGTAAFGLAALPALGALGAGAAAGSAAPGVVPATVGLSGSGFGGGGGMGLFGSILKGLGGPSGVISDVANLAGAVIGSNASKNAAGIQSAAADKALAVNQGVYAPYLAATPGALSNLQNRLNTPQQTFGGATAPVPGLSRLAGAPQTGMNSTTPGSPAVASAAPPQALWTVKAPTGETMQLSPAVAAQAIAKGAQRVG